MGMGDGGAWDEFSETMGGAQVGRGGEACGNLQGYLRRGKGYGQAVQERGRSGDLVRDRCFCRRNEAQHMLADASGSRPYHVQHDKRRMLWPR